MTMAFPLMSDFGMSAKGWWERCVAAAEDFYGRWLESTPLERLRLKPQVQVDPGYMSEVGTERDLNVAGHPS